MRAKRAKELRRTARMMSDTWHNYVAVQQRNAKGRPVKPLVVPGRLPILDDSGKRIYEKDGSTRTTECPCIVRTGMEVRAEEGTGKQMYKRLKHHYKANKARPHLYAKQRSWLRGVA